MYLCDFHTHSLISPDSSAPLADMAQAALERGLSELCVTDHCDLLDYTGHPNAHFDWAGAMAQFHQVQAQLQGKLTLRLGLELGSAPACPDSARHILRQGGDHLDFVLGSLHNWIGRRDNQELYFTDFSNNPALAREAMECCLTHTRTLVTQLPDCYDSLAHIIYPLRYIQRDGIALDIQQFEAPIREIFRVVAQSGHALEVNTCRGRNVEDWRILLTWFRDCGGEYVTLGSDAHRPEDMAKGISQAAQLLRQTGFTHVTVYRRRTPVLRPL